MTDLQRSPGPAGGPQPAPARPGGTAPPGLPAAAWRRATRAEYRWPSVAATGIAIALQLLLPDRLILHPRWVLPGLEIALAALLTVANPVRLDRHHPILRLGGLGLVVAMTVANAASAALLVDRLLHGQGSDDAASLLGGGAAIYGTNIIAFGLWYWELDRGGPFQRARGERQHTDFLFPQMATPEVAAPDWEPQFADYLYLSFTNATAFSPTDTMPLSRWAKMLMLVQSAIALVTIGLVIARAVNVLH